VYERIRVWCFDISVYASAKLGIILGIHYAVTLTGFGMIAAFVLIEQSSQQPMLPLRLFCDKTFSTDILVGFLLNFSFYGQLFVISLYFLQIRHLSPLMTGFALLPQLGIMVVASTLSGRVSGRFGPRWPMSIGLLFGATSLFAQLAISSNSPDVMLTIFLLALGFGMAFTMPAMTVAIMSHSPSDHASIASGALNAFRQLGGSFGVAALGGLAGGYGLIKGLHLGVGIAAVALFISAILSIVFVRKTPGNQRG
jgi:MFS transporter, DHA2 family, methylenomycin A resistance protein